VPSQKKPLRLTFPAGGKDRRLGFQDQRPFTTYNAKNVRSKASIEGRERGGSRPGLIKKFYSRLGTSSRPIRLLGEVEVLKTDGTDYWADNFQGGGIGGVWVLADWSDPDSGATIPTDTTLLSNAGSLVDFHYVRLALPAFDSSSAYDIELFVVPYHGVYAGEHIIYAGLHDSSPDITAHGYEARLRLVGTGGKWVLTVVDVSSGTRTVTSASGTLTNAAATPGIFRVNISSTTLKAYWQETLMATVTMTSAVGERFGFGLNGTESGGAALIDTFRIMYDTGLKKEWPRRLICAATDDGEFWVEGTMGQLSKKTFSPAMPLGSGFRTHCAQRGQKLYIADHGTPRASGSDGVISGTSLDSATFADWTALGISADTDVVEISGSVSGVTDGTYTIGTLAAGGISLGTSAGSGSGVTFRIMRGVKVYDPKADTMTLLTTPSGKGHVPVGNKAIAVYRDRLILAGSDASPHIWYMSRQGDFNDWDYTPAANDVGRAVAGTNAEAGLVGERITALAPFHDDFMLIGCENSLWLLRGDPAYLGSLDNISRIIGIVDQGAWCRTATGEIIFLSRDGLFALPPSGQGVPVSVSRERLPDELRDLDYRLYDISLIYDLRDRGIHIYATPVDTRPGIYFFFDWDTKGFWPLTLESDHDPTSAVYYRGSYSEDSRTVLGCRDGYIRSYNRHAASDDGVHVDSHVVIGPLLPGGDDFSEGILQELVGKLDLESGPVSWIIQVGETAQAAVSTSTEFESGSWEHGRSPAEHPRARGSWLAIRLEEEREASLLKEGAEGGEILMEDGSAILKEGGDRNWAMEGINIVFSDAGRARKL